MNEIVWVPISDVKPNPKNRNTHPVEQLKRLAELIKYQGWRLPIIVSKRSGLIVAGHGRLEAAKLLKCDTVPVHYQDFENEDQEYAFLVSDNAISAWSELDLAGINMDLGSFDPAFDLDLLGIKDFSLDAADKYTDKDPDEVPEAPKEPISKLGDLYELGTQLRLKMLRDF